MSFFDKLFFNSSPSIKRDPESGSNNPIKIFKRTDLPVPDFPRITLTWLFINSHDIESRINLLSNDLDIF